MPSSDDRFARQNRYGPPPEFPLASSWPGIVHHLSGPNMSALGTCCSLPAATHTLARTSRDDGDGGDEGDITASPGPAPLPFLHNIHTCRLEDISRHRIPCSQHPP
ncbi:hypothetical protein OTU49_012061 [Cherax quadricarinatus]|uniref:Uncharacterized protein n=1 Tax=Cherax quadricarinatus TaxID=27406 RepID=A0AAW0W0V3_CHEQU